MKKTIYAAVLFLTIGIAATSCKKDNNNIKESATTSITSIHKSWLANRDFESGFSFSVTKVGKILQLGARLEAGTYKVSLWDFDTKAKIDSANVTVTDSTKFSYASITPRSLTINKKYVVSVHTVSGKLVFFQDNGTIMLPKTIGSINIIDARDSNIPAYGPFPEQFVSTSNMSGFADFIFQED